MFSWQAVLSHCDHTPGLRQHLREVVNMSVNHLLHHLNPEVELSNRSLQPEATSTPRIYSRWGRHTPCEYGRQRGMGEGWDHLQSSSGLSLCPQGPSHPPTGSAWEPSACIPHMAPFRCVVPPLSRETSLPSFTRGGNRGCRVSPLVKSRA